MSSHIKKDTFTISIDALHIQLNHNLPTPLDLTHLNLSTGHHLYKQGQTTLTRLLDDQKNDNYNLTYSVVLDNKLIGYLDISPVRAAYAADLVLFRANNQLLYTQDLLPTINQFMKDFNLLFHNYTVLDISIDTIVDISKRFEKYFFNSKEYHFHRNKRQIEELNAFSTINRNGESNSTIYLAERVAGRSLKFYNKSIEIEKSKKEYITDYHKANGLPMDKDIWRLEVRITNNAIKKYRTAYKLKTDAETEITYYQYSKLMQTERNKYVAEGKHNDFEPVFEQLQNAEHLLSLFNHYTKGLAEFRKKDDSNISRCTRLPLINLGEDIKPLTAIEYIITRNIKYINTVKHNIKFQFEQFQKLNKKSYLTMAQEIATDNNMLEYYDTLYNQYKPVITAYNHSLQNYKITSKSLFEAD